MEHKNALNVSAAVCDVRSVTEETLAAYERVSISCAALITNPSTQALLARYQVELSAAQTLNLEEDVRVSTINGTMELTPSQTPPAEKTALIFNGSLDIAPGCEEVLKRYAAITVNGTVNAPESLTGLLSGFNINGTLRTYPDGCIRLKSTTVLDRTFPLRAKQDALYHAASRIIALSGSIDFQKLAEKNVRFSTKKLLTAESLVEAALPLFDETTDIQILPDGCAYLGDDVELTEALIRRHGGKLYIGGDLTLLTGGPWLDQISYLFVDGDILATQELADRLTAIDAAYNSLYIVGGTLLSDKPTISLTRTMLENADHGLSLVSCAKVTVAQDVPVQLLQDKLVSVIACAKVVCTDEQRAVIEPLAQDVAKIGPLDSAQDEESKDPNVVRISSAFYTF